MTTMQNPYVDDENTPLPDQTPQSPQSQQSQQSPQFPPSRSYSYLNEQYGQFGQPQSMPPSYQSPQPSHQPAPGQFQPPPAASTPTTRPSRGAAHRRAPGVDRTAGHRLWRWIVCGLAIWQDSHHFQP